MRNILPIGLLTLLLSVPLALLRPASVDAAGSTDLAAADKLTFQSKSLPVKGRSSRNPCAEYGAGFGKVDGTDTCVKIGGAVSVDVTSSGRPR